MQTQNYLSYGELAWTEPIIAPPATYESEVTYYVNLIQENAINMTQTLLHLGCGAGGYDFIFKQHFQVTGIDMSSEMLAIARQTNPEVTYFLSDMRNFQLSESFDVVIIPDSIDYMITSLDLQQTINCAYQHLKPGGLLVIVAKTREEFWENNFCYQGSQDDVQITIFENNYLPATHSNIYEATLIYLIRQQEQLTIYTDRHILGLFSQSQWLSGLQGAGFQVKQFRLDDVYAPFILGEGDYPMQVFVGIKS